MTNIHDLLAAKADELPWVATHSAILYSVSDDALATTMVNAAPLVLEYMKNGHVYPCPMADPLPYNSGAEDKCDCGYSALARALDVMVRE